MIATVLFGLCSTGLIGLGLFGLFAEPQPLRKILAFNLMGAGVFLLIGAIAERGGSDPVPQALVITGMVVAFAATALAVALLARLRAAKD